MFKVKSKAKRHRYNVSDIFLLYISFLEVYKNNSQKLVKMFD